MDTARPKILLLALVLLSSLACLSGCATSSIFKEHGTASPPYAGTRQDIEVAWDVVAMRYEKYSDECPAPVGWIAMADLPLSFVADTALLPFSLFRANKNSSEEPNAATHPEASALAD